VNEGAKGFKVSTLVTSASDRARRGKDIKADTMACELSAKMFEFVVPVAFTKGFQGKPYMLDDLVKRCHADYYKSADGGARTAGDRLSESGKKLTFINFLRTIQRFQEP